MNFLTIEKLRTLNESLSRQELIDKYYTKNQKNEFRRLRCITVLLLFATFAIFITMLILDQFFQSYKQYSIIVYLGSGLSFYIIAHTISKTQKKCGIVVLTSTFYQEIVVDHIKNINEGLYLVRFHKFKEFCKQESISITKEQLLFIKEQLIEDSKDTEIDDFSSAQKWFKTTLISLGTSLFSVCLSKLISIENIILTFFSTFIFIFVIGFIIIQINIWKNNRRVKRMNKYQDLLKIIDIAQFELIKEKQIALIT